jgi:hypothetical protein
MMPVVATSVALNCLAERRARAALAVCLRPFKSGVDYAIMATFAERMDQLRQARDTQATEAAAVQEAAYQSNWDRTVEQLRKLIRAEIEVTDDLGVTQEIQQPLSYGTPEGRFAVISLDKVWFGLPVSASAVDDKQLLVLVHCVNNHVLHLEYPTSADDSWDQALMRAEAAQGVYANPNNCPHCVAERTVVRPYQPKLA